MIRRATIQDSTQIFNLFSENSLDPSRLEDFSYQEKLQHDGFVIGDETEEDFKKYIQNKKYAFVFEEDKILGFLFGDHDTDYADDETKTWFDLKVKDYYYNSPNSYSLGLIVVGKESREKGIATKLLQQFEEELKKDGGQYLFAMVRILPLTNCASILFHARNKFMKIATASPTTRSGLENSASFLYFKKIT